MRHSFPLFVPNLDRLESALPGRWFRARGQECPRNLLFPGIGGGRLCFRLVALGLLAAGLFALLQSATGRLLPHDVRYLTMDTVELCGVGQGRVTRFMFHDRVSFGGALIAIGLLYLWLEQNPLKAGEAWAWWTFLLSGLSGFGSFLAYLGYGYFDLWHGLATAALLPLYVGGLMLSWGSFSGDEKSGRGLKLVSEALRPTHPGSGHGLLLATALGLLIGGTTI